MKRETYLADTFLCIKLRSYFPPILMLKQALQYAKHFTTFYQLKSESTVHPGLLQGRQDVAPVRPKWGPCIAGRSALSQRTEPMCSGWIPLILSHVGASRVDEPRRDDQRQRIKTARIKTIETNCTTNYTMYLFNSQIDIL